MKPQHFRWTELKPGVYSIRRCVVPDPTMGPVKDTIGDATGKASVMFNVRGLMLIGLLEIFVMDETKVWSTHAW